MDFFNFILHIDEHLKAIIEQLGGLSYVALFLVIFAETGFVITPFFPGDSLLFATGALAGGGFLQIGIVLPVLLAAAILGDSVNYWIGFRTGPRARKNSALIRPEYLKATEDFYARHGGKTIILARFVPIVRTFAPFVAGVGKMPYQTFITYNVVGALLWVIGITMLGYFFGSIPVIKNNFEYVVIGIILLSVLPPFFEFLKHKRASQTVPSSVKGGSK